MSIIQILQIIAVLGTILTGAVSLFWPANLSDAGHHVSGYGNCPRNFDICG